ncbi:hypothetical protein EXIGLDRAFT_763676 [Exidia glandulosa HHB12029]|uniref:Uncharacterized protein n=1 Tax=Exidia glandulosa HHB12029 TaxID=1314781 RepID=A0A165LQK2_EXIGL|nr:hypothetical protein EXIGLDRAFT_763676 [Exidia glandulosa HHB12029]
MNCAQPTTLGKCTKSEGAQTDAETWKALLSLFRANSRDELVTMLGFSKAEITTRTEDVDTSSGNATRVSFAEPEPAPEVEREPEIELEIDEAPTTPSEQSDATKAATESTATELSLCIARVGAQATAPGIVLAQGYVLEPTCNGYAVLRA